MRLLRVKEQPVVLVIEHRCEHYFKVLGGEGDQSTPCRSKLVIVQRLGFVAVKCQILDAREISVLEHNVVPKVVHFLVVQVGFGVDGIVSVSIDLISWQESIA